MNSSIVIAQLMGPVMVLASLAVLIRPGKAVVAVKNYLSQEPALRFVMGIVETLTAIAILRVHFTLAKDWTAMITVIAALMLIEGVMYLFGFSCDCSKKGKCPTSKVGYILTGIIGLISGGILVVKGFSLV